MPSTFIVMVQEFADAFVATASEAVFSAEASGEASVGVAFSSEHPVKRARAKVSAKKRCIGALFTMSPSQS